MSGVTETAKQRRAEVLHWAEHYEHAAQGLRELADAATGNRRQALAEKAAVAERQGAYFRAQIIETTCEIVRGEN